MTEQNEQTEEAEAAYELLDDARLHERSAELQVAGAQVFALLDLARAIREAGQPVVEYAVKDDECEPSWKCRLVEAWRVVTGRG